MKNSLKFATIAALAIFVTQATAQTYNADVRATDVQAGTVNVNRLFATGFTGGLTNTLQPTNSVVWYVADTTGNGIPTNTWNISGTLLGFGPGGVLGADDQVLALDTVDGSRIGNAAGQITRTYASINNAFQTVDIYMLLWNFTNSPFTATFGSNAAGYATPQPLNTLGVYKIGQQAPPGVGNANWSIISPVWADQYIIPSGVPEPTTMALGAMGAIGALVLYRRRRS